MDDGRVALIISSKNFKSIKKNFRRSDQCDRQRTCDVYEVCIAISGVSLTNNNCFSKSFFLRKKKKFNEKFLLVDIHDHTKKKFGQFLFGEFL